MKEPVWIEERETLVLHDRLLALFGGWPGLRDRGLLQSALARPRQHHAYKDAPDIVALAAAYTVGIVRNGPFIDGNKRTGFLASALLLELNSYRFAASEEASAQAVLEVAAGNLDESGYEAFLRANVVRRKK
jgi:death on curing protein